MKHPMGSQALFSLLKCLCLLALCCLLAGCDITITIPNSNAANSSQCLMNCTAGPGSNGLKVFVEPDAGPTPVIEAISGAKKSVWMEMYLLTNNLTYLTLR